jgi:hypothetical protein
MFLKVLLTLSISSTSPTHPREADWALQVRTSGPIFRNRSFTLDVGALLGAMFDKQKRELRSINFVLFVDVFDL